jgi:hypothetical protein
MNESARPLGGRLPLADPATLTPAQRELYDQLIGSWGGVHRQAGHPVDDRGW